MGLFDSKSSFIGVALGVSGAFDKSRKTNKELLLEQPLERALVSVKSGQWLIPLD